MRGDLSSGAIDCHCRVVDEALSRADDWHTRLAQHLDLAHGCLVLTSSDDQDRTGAAHAHRVRMRVPSQWERMGELAGKPGRAAEETHPTAVHRAGKCHQIVVGLRVGDEDPLRVVMQEAPEGVWPAAKRRQIEKANRRSIVCLEQGDQVGDDFGATNLARFQGNCVDMLAATNRRSRLSGKCRRY